MAIEIRSDQNIVAGVVEDSPLPEASLTCTHSYSIRYQLGPKQKALVPTLTGGSAVHARRKNGLRSKEPRSCVEIRPRRSACTRGGTPLPPCRWPGSA